MIETTVLNFLSGKLRVPVLAEVPEKPPGSFAVVEKTGGGRSTGLKVKANAKEQQDACWVVETILNGDTVKRVVVPCAKITEIEDIAYKDDEALGYGVTISATPDSAGNTHYEYLKKGSA